MISSRTLTVINGDATSPMGEGEKHIFIPHVVNSIGRWGSGFVVAINMRWGMKPRMEYIKWYMNNGWEGQPFRLGAVQFVDVPNRITIANMVGQEGVIDQGGDRPPIRYGALGEAMRTVAEAVKMTVTKEVSEIHCPMFGSGLAGGNKGVILDMMREIWVDRDIDVYAYEFQEVK